MGKQRPEEGWGHVTLHIPMCLLPFRVQDFHKQNTKLIESVSDAPVSLRAAALRPLWWGREGCYTSGDADFYDGPFTCLQTTL